MIKSIAFLYGVVAYLIFVSTLLYAVGFVGNIYAESLIQNIQTPREIVLTMLIDDGLKSRGNRKNILSPKFKQIGLAFGKDSKGDSHCIAIFTDSFQEKNSNIGSIRISE